MNFFSEKINENVTTEYCTKHLIFSPFNQLTLILNWLFRTGAESVDVFPTVLPIPGLVCPQPHPARRPGVS